MKRAHAKKAERYVRFFESVHTHPAVRTLPSSAFKLWFDLNVQWTGGNNGRLIITPSEQAKRGWNSRSKLAQARGVLLARGLIKVTKYCGPNVYHKATLYALTHLDVAASEADGIAGSAATHDYRVLRSPESGHERDRNQVTDVTGIRSSAGENVTGIRVTANDMQTIEGEKVSAVSRAHDPVTLNQVIQKHSYQVAQEKKAGAAVAVDVEVAVDSVLESARAPALNEFEAARLRRKKRDERVARQARRTHA